MKKIIKLVKYQMNLYFKGTGFVMPFVAAAIFLYAIYSQKLIDVLSGFLTTGIFIFLIMAWIGISVAQQEQEEVEQILILKMNSDVAYFSGKLLFLVVLALIFTFLCILFPVVQNLIHGGDLFDRKLIASDIISSFFIVSGSAICGAFLGNLFHPRVFKNRKSAYTTLVFICVVSIAKVTLIQEIPFLEYILWVMPDITYPLKIFANVPYFDQMQSLRIFLIFILYAFFCGVLKSVLCHKNKF